MLPQAHQLSLKLMQRCPSCQAGISQEGIHVINETEEALFAHLECSRCRVKYVTYIISNPQGLVGNAMLTDLSYQETLNALESSELSDNDFLGLYKLITGNNFMGSLQMSMSKSNNVNNHYE